jgi:hypothetical protein
MVPFDVEIDRYYELLDRRSPSSMDLVMTGFKLPYDLSRTNERLRVYSLCDVVGKGSYVNNYYLKVEPRVIGDDPKADRELALSIANRQPKQTLEDVL